MTPREAAQRLEISPSAVYKLCSQRKLGYHKIGGAVRISQEQLDDFLAACEVRPVDAEAETPRKPRRVGREVIPEYVPLSQRAKRG